MESGAFSKEQEKTVRGAAHEVMTLDEAACF